MTTDEELTRLRAENARLAGFLDAHNIAWRMPAPATPPVGATPSGDAGSGGVGCRGSNFIGWARVKARVGARVNPFTELWRQSLAPLGPLGDCAGPELASYRPQGYRMPTTIDSGDLPFDAVAGYEVDADDDVCCSIENCETLHSTHVVSNGRFGAHWLWVARRVAGGR